MKKSTLFMILSLVLAIAVGAGSTLAYLTDTDADANVMTLGKVEIVQNEHQRIENEDGTYEKGIVDDQDSYLLEVYENDKPLLPIVGDPSKSGEDHAGWDETTVRMSQIGSYGGMQVFAGKNAVDKFVTVSNTGRSDAYVRTIVAIEVGSTDGSLIGTSYHSVWEKNSIGIVEINGNKYSVTEYDYPGAQLSDSSYRHENGVLPAGDTTYPSLAQVYLKSEADNEDVEDIDGNKNGKLDILVLSQAVQTEGFDDAATALNAGFGEANAENVKQWFAEMEIGSPGDKWPTNDTPLVAKVTTLDKDVKLVNDEGDVVFGPDRMIDTDGNLGTRVGKIPLDVAYQFEPTMSSEQGAESDYAGWHADFVVSADKDIPAYGMGLAGFYNEWCQYNNDCWVMMATDQVIEAGQEIRLVEALGATDLVTYANLCKFGNDGIGFLCGAVELAELGLDKIDGIIPGKLTPGTTLTVKLCLFETDENGTEIGEPLTVGVFTHTFY